MPVASGPGGVLYNTPTGGGLLSGLDPDYQAQQIQLKASQAFKDGVPTDDQGNPDFGAMASRMMQLGAYDQGDKLLNTGLQMQGLKFAQQASQDPLLTGGTPANGGGVTQGAAVAGGGAAGGNDAMAPFRNAVASIESKGSGDYSAIGQTQNNGDFAVGRYQVMASNIPAWTKEVLGQSMRPDEFAANPQAQDAVFNSKFGQYLRQTGSPQDAASMWFTGQPFQRGANRADSLGTTGSGYVNKFMAALGNQQPAGMARSGTPSAPAVSTFAQGAVTGGAAPSAQAAPGQTAATNASLPADVPLPPERPADLAAGGGQAAPDFSGVTIPDATYQAAKRIVSQGQGVDPTSLTPDVRQALARAPAIIKAYEAANPQPAPGASDGVQVAQNGASDAPVPSAHPFAPGGSMVPAQQPRPAATPQASPAPAPVPQSAPQQPTAAAAPRLMPAQGAPGMMIDPTMNGMLPAAYVGNPGGYARALRQRAAAYAGNPFSKPVADQLSTMASNIEKGIEREGLITPDMKNYQIAQQQGYAGSMMQFQADQAREKADAENASKLATAGPEAAAAAAGTAAGQNSPSAIQSRAANASAVAEAGKAGAALGELPAQLAKTATAAQATSDNIDQMLTAAQGFRMGQGAALDQGARKLIQSTLSRLGAKDPALDSSTASYEDFGKIAGVLNRNAAQQVGGRTGVQEMQLIGSTLPSPEMSYDGFRGVASSLKGTADYQVARMQAAQAWKAPNGPGAGSLNGFEADWAKNADPSAFWLHRLQVDQPDLFAQTAQKLGQTPQGRALIEKSMKSLSYLNAQGLLD